MEAASALDSLKPALVKTANFMSDAYTESRRKSVSTARRVIRNGVDAAELLSKHDDESRKGRPAVARNREQFEKQATAALQAPFLLQQHRHEKDISSR
jgi:hypothetical protein